MRGRMRTTIGVLAALSLGLATPSVSAAEQDSVADADDVEGLLDLARLAFSKAGDGSPLKIVVETHEAWGPRVLRLKVNSLAVLFDVDGDGSRDFRARIRRVGGDLVALIRGSGEAFEPLPVGRPNARTVRFTVPGGSPPNPEGPAPGLRARSRFIEQHECDPGSGQPACVDRAPDTGWL